MRLLNAVILSLTGFCLVFENVNADCSLELRSPFPQVVTHFGSKHLMADAPTNIQREDHQTVDLYCANGFKYAVESYNYKAYSGHHLQLTCNSNGYFLTSQDTEALHVECLGTQVSQLYESRSTLPDCDDYMSLVVGQNFEKYGSLKNVAICYDIVKQQLKYASYTAYPSKIKVIEMTQAGQLNRLGLDIEVAYTKSIFKTIGALDISGAFRKDRQLKTLFGEDTFEYTSLIQDEVFSRDILDFKEMLSIVWLRALRSCNWRHLLNALQIASLNAKYDVRIGVSGAVQLPMLQQCNETRTLTVELENGDTLSVPALIWAHVRALQPVANSTNEFVVVGHNSPFLTSNEREGLCPSMCQEVAWLKDSLFGKLQHYPVYGLVQCCRLSDITHKLDNFPMTVDDLESINQVSVSTTTETSLDNLL